MRVGDVMSAETFTTATDLVHEVDAMRAYVMHRMWGYRDEVDNVMQEARLVVWKTAGRYDPDRGDRNTWVFAIVSRVVTHEVHLLGKRAGTVEITESDGEAAPDWLDTAVTHHEHTRWLEPVADAASEIEWAVMVELIRHDGDAQIVAGVLDLRVRTVRAARDRVRALIRSARTAFALLDGDIHPTPVACIPDTGGLCETYAYVDSPVEHAAAALGIMPGVFRTRRALVRRIEALVEQIAFTDARI